MTWASVLDTLPPNFCYEPLAHLGPQYPLEIYQFVPQMKTMKSGKNGMYMDYPKSRSTVKKSHDNIHDNNSRYVVLA